MASLSPTAPPLVFDEAELKKWGYIWRVGLKPRAVKEAAGEEPDDDDEGDADAEGVADADGEENGEVAEVEKIVAAKGKAVTVTAEEVGVPPEVLALFKPDKKYPF